MKSTELLTTREAAAVLGVQPKTLENWRRTGIYGLPFIRFGQTVRYSRSDLDAWLAKYKVTPIVRIQRIAEAS